MTIDGAYNILSDPAITESSELQIAVKALIALALANKPKRYRECECFWHQVCPKCHWAKHITRCGCPKEQA